MGYAIGIGDYGRDIGYGVPAECDSPDCHEEIDRGMSYLCGEWQTDNCCGLYFCSNHLTYAENQNEGESPQLCEPCAINWKLGDDWESFVKTYDPKPDTLKWIYWKLHHDSWQNWRDENQEAVSDMVATVKKASKRELKSVIKELSIEEGFRPTTPEEDKH